MAIANSDNDDARRKQRKAATDAAKYRRNVASGKQEFYKSNKNTSNRTVSILKQLPESKIHLLQPVLERLSQYKRSSARLISSCIYKCNLEYELSLSASASDRSDDGNAVSSTNAESGTATSTEDTLAHATVNHNADNGQSNPPIVSEDAPNLNITMAAAAAPADGATLITPDKPADICNGQTTNDGGDLSALASEDTNYLSEEDDFGHFSDSDDNIVATSPVCLESESDADQDTAPAPTKKRRRLTREVDALARSLPGSLPLDGNDWNRPVRPMTLWKAYGSDKISQQPTSISLHNSGQFAFYTEETGIHRIDFCFVPKNTRFPNDDVMDEAAIAARALIADEFGGDELLNQRDRKYSAPGFHTIFYVDRTCTTCSAVHDQGVNNACETYFPTNKCISVAYFTKLEGDGDGGACVWIEWLVTAKDYRNRKLGVGKLLLENILHLALLDEGVDSVYLEVGSGNLDWEAARHVYSGVGFRVASDLSAIPKAVEKQCKHLDDISYDILHFDCEKNTTLFDNE